MVTARWYGDHAHAHNYDEVIMIAGLEFNACMIASVVGGILCSSQFSHLGCS